MSQKIDISIIICNHYQSRVLSLKQNIEEFIGNIAYEIIVIDNSNNKYSIFEAYNIGIKKSIGKFLLFIHDDIEFRTFKFGEVLLTLSLPNLGVLGIAGSKLKTRISSPWWISNHERVSGDVIYQYCIQHYQNKEQKKINVGFKRQNQVVEVILVDGVFLYTTKENCLNNPFDVRYNSFHFYDLDFSLNLNKNGKTNYVSNSVLLEHFSAGSLNKDWVMSSFLFEKKWHEFKKVKTVGLQKKTYFERLAFNSRFRVLLDNKFNKKAIILFLSNIRFLSMNNFKILVKSIL